MTVEPTVGAAMVGDELRSVVSMLCTRFPEARTADIEWLVADVYQTLSENARIRAHLIPLTLNRCRRLLIEHPLIHPDHCAIDHPLAVGV